MLGYFNQKSIIREKLNQFDTPRIVDDSLEEKLAKIVEKAVPFAIESRDWKYILRTPYMPLPQFMAVPNSLETKQLKEKYSKEREEIRKIFANRDLIEVVFEQLMDK